MNTHDIEILLIGMVISSLSLTLFVYLGNTIFNFLKVAGPARYLLNKRNSKAETSISEKRRRRDESQLTLVCSLPIHQEKRPEAPLS
jgi:hypothetical protein